MPGLVTHDRFRYDYAWMRFFGQHIAIATATLGFAGCFILPFNIAVAVISGLKARDYVRNTGAHGSILYVIVAVVLGAIVLCGGLNLLFGGLSALVGSSTY